MSSSAPATSVRLASGLSSNPQSLAAADHACEQVVAGLEREHADLVFLFFSSHHAPQAEQVAAIVREKLHPRCLVGLSAESVIGGAVEIERAPGLSVLAAHLPGVDLTTFTHDQIVPPDDESPEALAAMGLTMGAGPRHRATFFFADPFSVPMVKLLPAMNRALRGTALATPASPTEADASSSKVRGPILVGGMASGARSPGGNILILNDRIMRSGGVGVSLSGKVRIDAVVSQGCRAFGPTSIVTRARGNVIFELGGKSSPDAVREAIEQLGDKARGILKEGLFVGVVINEYKDRFGRDDFLIRNIVGLDSASGGIAVADLVRVGQTIRFHHRDRETASQDLSLLLDAQQLHERPAGCLLVTCNGRGQRLFGTPHHDASSVVKAFGLPAAGEDLAKMGREISAVAAGQAVSGGATGASGGGSLPLAGFFAAGEIGPVGGQSFLHGHTACVVLFRNE